MYECGLIYIAYDKSPMYLRTRINPQTSNHNNCRLRCHLLVIFKVISANSVDSDQEQSDLGQHCLPVCKNRFEKIARIFSRRHKQTTFSDAGFLGILRVKMLDYFLLTFNALSKFVENVILEVTLLF